MGDDLQVWRSRIGLHVHTSACRCKSSKESCSNGSRYLLSFGVRTCMFILLVVCMSVEVNPGPTDKDIPCPSTPIKFYGATTPNQSSPSQLAAHRLLQNARSPAKTRLKRFSLHFPLHEGEPATKRQRKNWSLMEDQFLVGFVSSKYSKWPAMDADHIFWQEAADYLSTEMCQEPRKSSSIRSRVVNTFTRKYTTIEQAQIAFGLQERPAISTASHQVPDISHLHHDTRIELAIAALQPLNPDELEGFVRDYARSVSLSTLGTLLDSLFLAHSLAKGVTSNPKDFGTLSTEAMLRLQAKGRPNLMHKFAQCIAVDREDTHEPLMPMTRMPFGLVQYQIDFFSSVTSSQVHMPDDYKQFQEMMEIEFGTRFNKLFRGPAWSGLKREDWKYVQKARINVAGHSHRTVSEDISRSQYTKSPEIQEAALLQLKEGNPNGRFWIKLDGTDLKAAIQESVAGVWNGDADLLDGKLQTLRELYDTRVDAVNERKPNLNQLAKEFKQDKEDLMNMLERAVTKYKEKSSKPKTSEETLKELSWDLVETSDLLEHARTFASAYSNMSGSDDDYKKHVGLHGDLRPYLTGLFKKKRQPAASHVLVIMLSDEKRATKPYAMPIQYIPYHSLKDVDVRRFTKKIKEKMISLGMECVGTVTDGEFSTLRTKGESRPIHISEIRRLARDSVKNKSRKTLELMLLKSGETEDGDITVARPGHVPQYVIRRLDTLRKEGVSYPDALRLIRESLVPPGYKPKTWREHVPETIEEMLKSIIATFNFRKRIENIREEFGVDFSQHLSIPEIDNTTSQIHHRREDHNHIVKRLAQHTREGGFAKIDLSRFYEAMKSPNTDLDNAALTGVRKQNVSDAEKLLSHAVADFFYEKDYREEGHYVRTIALWHEASDGRGMSQEERRAANQGMMDMILDEWIPWHKTTKDFSLMDINVRLKGVCGFSRETVIAVTTNIESQELRRLENDRLGPEHPRAGTTDDVECFFSLLHRICRGLHVTLKDFKHWWQKLITQFVYRIDPNLPFYFWTANERFKVGDEQPFDVLPEDQEAEGGRRMTRLHRLQRRRRTDSSIVAPGRASLPARNKKSIRQSLYSFAVGLPPVPEDMQAHIQGMLNPSS